MSGGLTNVWRRTWLPLRRAERSCTLTRTATGRSGGTLR